MLHLLPSRCTILRLDDVGAADGTSQYLWDAAIEDLPVRVDLAFVRTGRDNFTVEAGHTPDRTGTAFFNGQPDVRGGDRIRIESGPLNGMTFEVDPAPDLLVDSSQVHHLEAAVKEVTQRR